MRAAIARLTQGYGPPADFFIQKLPEGVGGSPPFIRVPDDEQLAFEHFALSRDLVLPIDSNDGKIVASDHSI